MPLTPDMHSLVVRRLALPYSEHLLCHDEFVDILTRERKSGFFSPAYFKERWMLEVANASARSPISLLIVEVASSGDTRRREAALSDTKASQRLGELLRLIVPPEALPCRLPGDRFGVMLPGFSVVNAEALRRRLEEAAAQHGVPSGDNRSLIPMQIRAASVTVPTHGTDASELLDLVDAILRSTGRSDAVAIQSADWAAVERGRNAPLVGRQPELRQVSAALERAKQGRGAFFLLTGPCGIGKTRLLREVAADARNLGFAVIESRPGGSRGAEALFGLLRKLQAGISQRQSAALARRHWALHWLLERQAGRAVTAGPGLDHFADAVRFLVGSAYRRQPLLWILDDIGQEDVVIQSALGRMATSLNKIQLVILAVARVDQLATSAHSPWWERFHPVDRFVRLEIGPLSIKDSAILAGQVLGCRFTTPALTANPVVQGGNPLLIVQSAHLVDGPGEVGDGRSLFRDQLTGMSEDRRRVVEAAAVLGSEFDPEVLVGICLIRPDLFHREVKVLIRTGWFERGPDGRLQFCHVLAQQVAHDQMDSDRRRVLHLAAGHLLAGRQNRKPAEVAMHFATGMDWYHAQQWYRTAAEEEEAVGAFAEAARHLRSLLAVAEASGAMPAESGRLADRCGDLFMRTLDFRAAAEVSQWGLAYCRTSPERGALLWRLARMNHYERNAMAEYTVMNQEAIRLLRPAGPSLALANGLTDQVFIEAVSGNAFKVRAFSREAIAVIKALADPIEEVRLLAAIANGTSLVQPYSLARQCLGEADTRLRALPNHPSPGLARAAANLLFTSRYLGDYARCVYYGDHGLRLAEKTGDVQVLATILSFYCETLTQMGDVSTARPLLKKMMQPLQFTPFNSAWIDLLFAQMSFYQGDLAEAAVYADRAVQSIPNQHTSIAVHRRRWMAQIQMASGEAPLLNEWPLEIVIDPRQVLDASTWLTATQVYLWHGEVEWAQLLLNTRGPTCFDQTAWPWLEYTRALLHHEKGHPAEALRAFGNAAGSLGNAYFRAVAAKKAAQMLIESGGSRRAAVAYLRTAGELFRRMGNTSQGRVVHTLENDAQAL